MKVQELFTKILTVALTFIFMFTLASCGSTEEEKVTLSVNPAQTVIHYGDNVNLNVSITGSDQAYDVQITDPTLVKVENGVISVLKEVEEEKSVIVIIVARADKSQMQFLSFTVAPQPTIEITTIRSTIAYGEEVTLNAKIVGLVNKAYTWSVSDPTLVKIDNNVLSVLHEVSVDTMVTIKATSNENKNLFVEKQIKVKAPSSFGSIVISTSQNTIAEGEEIIISALVTGLSSQEVEWSLSNEDYVKISGNKIVFVNAPAIDKLVTLTATSKVDESVYQVKSITVKATIVDGQVGELTTALISEIANDKITVTGTITDIYTDFNNSFNSSRHVYESVVKMEDGLWYGSWHVQNSSINVITQTYQRGSTDVKDANGNVGHALEQLFVNKNNEVEAKAITNYLSIPTIWETQHLWNHLGNLNVNKFSYDAENEVYAYNIDYESLDDLYLMTYFSFCLTPMLEDTLNEFYLVIENGKITKILAQTEILYYGGDSSDNASSMSYTLVELVLSDIGTTSVPLPSVYQEDANTERLQQAINNMQALDNYTFQAAETNTYSAYNDYDYDYEYEASTMDTSGASGVHMRVKFGDRVRMAGKVHNNVSATGTPGLFGAITAEAILLASTGEYSYSMDGDKYHTEYSGYKQNADGTYDHFEYNTTTHNLEGKRRIAGSVLDVIPKFDFSAAIFKFVGTQVLNNELTYKYQLRDAEISRSVAVELCMHSYADDAIDSSNYAFELYVSESGYIVGAQFAYSIYDIYSGFIKTTYSKFNETVLENGVFDDYVPRENKTSWSQFNCMYYYANHSTIGAWEYKNTELVLKEIFGDEAYLDIPQADIFVRVFDDVIYGPFFDWKDVYDTDGETVIGYKDYVSINTAIDNYDENGQVSNEIYQAVMQKLIDELEALGFEIDEGNSRTNGGTTGRQDRYLTFVKGDIEIVVWNNFTKNFSVYFYHLGDWIL